MASSFNLNFWIFPLAVLGNVSPDLRKKTCFGAILQISGHKVKLIKNDTYLGDC